MVEKISLSLSLYRLRSSHCITRYLCWRGAVQGTLTCELYGARSPKLIDQTSSSVSLGLSPETLLNPPVRGARVFSAALDATTGLPG